MTTEIEIQKELPASFKKEVEIKTSELTKEISAIEVKDEETASSAKLLQKSCTALEWLIEDKRKEITKPLNDFVSGINSLAKELVEPISKAKDEIKLKQIKYAQELERQRLEKENEVLAIIAKVQAMPDEVELELYADTVTNPDLRIKSAIEAKRGYFEEQERQRKMREAQEIEAKRLAQIAKEQWEEAALRAREQAEEKLRLQKAQDELARQQEDSKQKDAEEMAEFQRQQVQKQQSATRVKGLRKVVMFEVTDPLKVPRELCTPDDSKIRESLKENFREIPGLRVWVEDKIQ